MLPKVVKQNVAHELLMNTYIVVVVGQRYYCYIDSLLFICYVTVSMKKAVCTLTLWDH